MNPKSAVTAVLLLFVAISVGYLLWGGSSPETGVDRPESRSVSAGAAVVAYYFHGNMRCKSPARQAKVQAITAGS